MLILTFLVWTPLLIWGTCTFKISRCEAFENIYIYIYIYIYQFTNLIKKSYNKLNLI